MKDIPAIGPGGKPTGKTYGDYAKTAQDSPAPCSTSGATATNGHIFAFPKCDFHVNAETFRTPPSAILQYACQIASENGTPYFIFDRDEVTLAACCRLRTTITTTT